MSTEPLTKHSIMHMNLLRKACVFKTWYYYLQMFVQSRVSLPHSVFPMEESPTLFPYGDTMSQFSANLLSSTRNHGMQMPLLDTFSNAPLQVIIVGRRNPNQALLFYQVVKAIFFLLQVSGGMWEDDLQSIVQMGIPPNQSLSLHGK